MRVQCIEHNALKTYRSTRFPSQRKSKYLSPTVKKEVMVVYTIQSCCMELAFVEILYTLENYSFT